MNTKQVIIVRTDLGMRRGKQIAQACHASMAVLLNMATITDHTVTLTMPEPMRQWVSGQFTKIVVGIDNEADLLTLQLRAQIARIPCALITDSGKTEFHGVPTITALAIGPDTVERIDPITGHLTLL